MGDQFEAEHFSPTDPSAASPFPADPSANPALTEDRALAELEHRDLQADRIEQISQNSGVRKSRKVRLALSAHPHTPRRIALRVIRELYTFELMQFALTPAAPADLRRVADELLVARLAGVTLGERISLARRSSERVAGALLLDKETPVWQAAMESPRLTESAIFGECWIGGGIRRNRARERGIGLEKMFSLELVPHIPLLVYHGTLSGLARQS